MYIYEMSAGWLMSRVINDEFEMGKAFVTYHLLVSEGTHLD